MTNMDGEANGVAQTAMVKRTLLGEEYERTRTELTPNKQLKKRGGKGKPETELKN